MYNVVGSYPVGASMIFGKVGAPAARGLSLIYNPFLCCGITAIHSFGQLMLTNFAEQADFLAGLWAINRGKTHFMYILTDAQTKLRGMEHAALLEVGSVQVCEFNNLNHSPHNLLKVFVVDLNMGIGKFFNEMGVPYATPPEVAAPAREATVKVIAQKETA